MKISLRIPFFSLFATFCAFPVLGQSTWKVFRIGTSSATIEVPYPLKVSNVSLAPAAMRNMAVFDAYRGDSPDSTLLVSYGVYKKRPPGLDAAAKSAVANVKLSSSAPGFTAGVSKLKAGGRQARLVKASFKSHGGTVDYRQLIVDDGLKRWQIAFYFPTSNKAGPASASRIFQSFKLK